jgi:hypothetical protein
MNEASNRGLLTRGWTGPRDSMQPSAYDRLREDEMRTPIVGGTIEFAPTRCGLEKLPISSTQAKMVPVSLVADKEQILNNVVRLRRAEQLSPDNEDIVAVRSDLERAVGPTVRRAMAARVLGVSQTALDRWIAQGDIPSVITRTGRREVPLHALVDLIEAVDERTRTSDDRHPLASVLRQRRSDAEQLDPRTILPRRYRRTGRERGHRGAELRSLAYHRAVAQRLDNRIVEDALHRVRQWRAAGKIDPRYADQWEEILSWPLPRMAKLISQDGQRARDLRQNSPFAGVLNERERRRVLDVVGSAAR